MTIRKRGGLLAYSGRLGALLALAAGCSVHSNVDVDQPTIGYSSESSPIQVVTTVIGGKNVFIPSTLVVTGGRPQSLSIYNTTDKAHGFRIAALGIEVILVPGQETAVELPALEGGRVLRIDCHLHPPHRTATLVVLPGR